MNNLKVTRKEFDLSEKIVSNMEESDWDIEGNPLAFTNNLSIHTEDVKEFIKINKESEVIDEFGVGWIKTKDFLKLAGKMLIELTNSQEIN